MTIMLIGLILTLTPLLLIGIVFIKRNVPILLFYIAMCILGIGYLMTTGAIEDIGTMALLFASQLEKN